MEEHYPRGVTRVSLRTPPPRASGGGRPDLAGTALPRVQAATLLIVGGADEEVIELNERALALLACERRLVTVPGATHLFPEPGTLVLFATGLVLVAVQLRRSQTRARG